MSHNAVNNERVSDVRMLSEVEIDACSGAGFFVPFLIGAAIGIVIGAAKGCAEDPDHQV